MIKLTGTARKSVICAVSLRQEYDGPMIHGKVLAMTGTEYVTWLVSSHNGGESYDAYSGNYLMPGDTSTEAYLVALEHYNSR